MTDSERPSTAADRFIDPSVASKAEITAVNLELQRSNARLETLVNNSTVVFYTRAPEPPFAPTYTSPNVVAHLGYQPQDFTSDPAFWASKLHPDDAPGVLAALPLVFERGVLDREYRFRRADGSYRWLRDELRLVRTAGEVEIVGTWIDVTDRKGADQALRDNEESLAVTLASIGDAVLATDATGRITRMNSVAERLTGWSQAEARGRSLAEVFRVTNELTREPAIIPVAEVLATGLVHGSADRTALIARDGAEHTISERCAPIRGLAGSIVGAVLVFRDATQERRREAWHQTILETSIDGFWVVDREGRFLNVNPAYCRMSGYSRAELLRLRIADVEEFEAPEDIRRRVEKVVATGSDRFETRHRRKDGTTFDVQVSTQYSDWLGGTLVVFVEDITDRKRAKAELSENNLNLERIVTERTGELRATERRFHDLFEFAVDATIIANADGLITLVNRRAEALFGYAREELVGQPVEKLVPEAVRSNHVRQRTRFLPTTTPRVMGRANLHAQKKDGTIFPADISLGPLTSKGDPMVVVVVCDITERRRSEAQIADALLYTRTLLDTAPVGILTYKASGEAVSANFASAELVGATVEQLKAQNFRHLDSWRESGLLAAAEAALGSNTPRDVEISAVSSFGKPLRIRSRFVPFVVSHEQHLLALFEDVRDVRNAEDALRRSLLEKETLLKEIHHRVKNNLQIIASLLAMQSEASVEVGTRASLRESINRVRSMGLIHERLYQSSTLALVDFGEYLMSLTTFLFRSYSVTSSVRLLVEAEKVEVNIETAVPLGLILNELVSNAFKHAFTDGKPGELRVTLRPAREGFALSVADSGPGLPPGFDIAKAKTLGLSLVSSLVRQLKATMTIERDEGTSFRIEFKELTYAPR